MINISTRAKSWSCSFYYERARKLCQLNSKEKINGLKEKKSTKKRMISRKKAAEEVHQDVRELLDIRKRK